jgi:CubicO group peptidase (beta-lactamase class C family)
MAYICEVVAVESGLATDFDDFVRKSIYQPLGIDLNEVGYFAKDFPSLAAGPYAMPSINTGKKWLNCETYAVMDYPTCDWRSSSKNYAKMLGMFIQDGTYQGKQILKKETVQYMKQKSNVSGSIGSSETCSNALWLYEKNLLPGYAEVMGHDGSDAGISTYAYFNPETGVGYVLLTNADQDGSGNVDKQSTNIGSKLMNTFDTKAKLNTGLQLGEDSLRTQRHLKAKLNAAGNPGSMSPPGCDDYVYNTIV